MFFHDLLGRLAFAFPIAMAAFWIALATVHVAFALAVFRHSAECRDSGRRLVFVGPGLWTLATLVSGVLAATSYWLLHCSTLALPVPTPVPLASAEPTEDLPRA